MRIVKATFICAVLVMLAGTCALAKRETGPNFYSLVRYETHDQQGNGDFVYNGLFMSGLLQPKYQGMLSYINKYSLNDGRTDSHIGGVTLTNLRTDRLALIYSYSHYGNPESVTRKHTDSDRWLFMGKYKLGDVKASRFALFMSYASSTDFSVSRTLNTKLKYDYGLTDRLKSALYAQYSHSFNLSENIFNMYGIDLSYKLSKRYKLSLSYIFIDMDVGTVDDDNILQLGLFTTL
ncbi:MAG: hypothetical protein ABIH66_14725 [bacterium]